MERVFELGVWVMGTALAKHEPRGRGGAEHPHRPAVAGRRVVRGAGVSGGDHRFMRHGLGWSTACV